MTQAYNEFRSKRQTTEGSKDILTVIQFNESQTVVCDAAKLSNGPSLKHNNHGKALFAPALNRAQVHMSKCPAYRPMLVFVSNGEDGSERPDDVESAMREMVTAAPEVGLAVYVIGLGKDTDPELLENMAAVSGGEYYRACERTDLSQVFGAIAAECSALEGLTGRFGEVISGMVSNKIIVDHM